MALDGKTPAQEAGINLQLLLNGTIIERLKVMRGLQNNHIKIHSAFRTTPAIKAKIKGNIEGNRWMELLKKSFK